MTLQRQGSPMTIDPKDNNIEVVDRMLYLLKQAGTEGMRPRDMAEAIGKHKDGLSFAAKKILTTGKAARIIYGPNRSVFWAIEYAPPEAKTLPKKTKEPKAKKERWQVTETLEMLAKAAHRGMLTSEIARARNITVSSAGNILARLIAAGKCVSVFIDGKTKRYFVPQYAPAHVEPVAQQLLQKAARPPTTIRISPSRMDPDAPPIITERTKITVAKAPPGRFEFDPPPGWRGQITRDWRERRLQTAQSTNRKSA